MKRSYPSYLIFPTPFTFPYLPSPLPFSFPFPFFPFHFTLPVPFQFIFFLPFSPPNPFPCPFSFPSFFSLPIPSFPLPLRLGYNIKIIHFLWTTIENVLINISLYETRYQKYFINGLWYDVVIYIIQLKEGYFFFFWYIRPLIIFEKFNIIIDKMLNLVSCLFPKFLPGMEEPPVPPPPYML